jgi:hypothetical protein
MFKVSHSEIHFDSFWYYVLLSHYNFLPDTCKSLQSKVGTLRLWLKCAYNESIYPHNVWTAWKRTLIKFIKSHSVFQIFFVLWSVKLNPDIENNTLWTTSDLVLVLWRCGDCVRLHGAHYYIIGLNKIRNVIWTVCITGRRGAEWSLNSVCG